MTNTTDYLSKKYESLAEMDISKGCVSIKDLISFCRLTQLNYFKIKELEASIMRIDREIKEILHTEEKMNEEDEDYTEEETKIFMKPIDDEFLSLPARITNQLLYEKIFYVGELIRFTEHELLKIPNLGRKGIFDIKFALKEHNLYLKSN